MFRLAAIALLATAIYVPRMQAALIQNDQTANFFLGASGAIETDFIYSFCPTNSPKCLPSPVTMTSARVNVTVRNSINNVEVSLTVIGAGAFGTIACTGPGSVSSAGANYDCLFPFALNDTKGIGSLSRYVFTPVVTFDRTTGQNGTMLLFVEATSATPEPGVLSLVAGGIAALIVLRRGRGIV